MPVVLNFQAASVGELVKELQDLANALAGVDQTDESDDDGEDDAPAPKPRKRRASKKAEKAPEPDPKPETPKADEAKDSDGGKDDGKPVEKPEEPVAEDAPSVDDVRDALRQLMATGAEGGAAMVKLLTKHGATNDKGEAKVSNLAPSAYAATIEDARAEIEKLKSKAGSPGDVLG